MRVTCNHHIKNTNSEESLAENVHLTMTITEVCAHRADQDQTALGQGFTVLPFAYVPKSTTRKKILTENMVNRLEQAMYT